MMDSKRDQEHFIDGFRVAYPHHVNIVKAMQDDPLAKTDTIREDDYYFKVFEWLSRIKDLTWTDKAVYSKIQSYILLGRFDYCYLSLGELATQLGISKSTARRSRQHLVSRDMLRVVDEYHIPRRSDKERGRQTSCATYMRWCKEEWLWYIGRSEFERKVLEDLRPIFEGK